MSFMQPLTLGYTPDTPKNVHLNANNIYSKYIPQINNIL